MLAIAPDFEPEDRFSPTALKIDRECPTKYFLRYFVGYREPEIEWADLPPEPDKKKEPEAHRAWQRIARPALGTECHSRLEAYYSGHDVDWYDRPGSIALAGLHQLPHPSKCLTIETEADIAIDLSFVFGEFPELRDDPIALKGTRDLVVADVHGHWLLIDHKTTYTFDFYDREKTKKTVKTPEELRADEQANMYGLDVMQKRGLRALDCRWVYYRTEDTPDSRAVDFYITIEEAQAAVRRLVIQAMGLRARMRELMSRPDAPLEELLAAVPRNYEMCGGYGGCPHQIKRGLGGICEGDEGETVGQKIIRLGKKARSAKVAKAARPEPQPKKARTSMSFRKAADAAGITKPGAAATKPAAAAPATTPATEPEQAPEQAQEPAAETTEPEQAETPAPAAKPAAARRGPSPKVAEGITATVDGHTFEVAAGSAVGKQLAKASKALLAAQAAFDGE